MQEIKQQFLSGERALYASKDLKVFGCVFDDGESPLKESENIEVNSSLFRWKYPLWYCNNITVSDSTWFEMARAGVWYSNHLNIKNSVILAPKNFRRCVDLTLEDVNFTNAQETLWACKDVTLKNVSAVNGPYFLMNSENLYIDGLTLDGNYSFDGAKNVEIHNSRLLTKDAFWNSENVVVYDSMIVGEYLGWNSKNLTLINCTIESLQGMCYIDNLVMKNCKLINTTLAFEYSTVEADIDSRIESILNPTSGTIKANEIGELIIEKDKVNPANIHIICDSIEKQSHKPAWL